MKSLIAMLGVVVMAVWGPLASAAQQCPPELAQAQAKIASTEAAMGTQAPRTGVGYEKMAGEAPRGQDTQAPRTGVGYENIAGEAPRGQDAQAPRTGVGYENIAGEAPRGQDAQAPRTGVGYEKMAGEAPRGQDAQAPRTGVGYEKMAGEAPRGQDAQAAPRAVVGAEDEMQPKLERARTLAAEAEQACKAGDMSLSSQKAKAALEALR